MATGVTPVSDIIHTENEVIARAQAVMTDTGCKDCDDENCGWGAYARLEALAEIVPELISEIHRLQGELYAEQTEERGVEEYLALRYADDPVEAFDLFVKHWVSPKWHAHLLNDDENDGEFVRGHIRRAMGNVS